MLDSGYKASAFPSSPTPATLIDHTPEVVLSDITPAPAFFPAIASILEYLPSSTDLPGDLDSLSDLLSRSPPVILDPVLPDTLEFLFSVLNFELSKIPIGGRIVMAVLRVLKFLTEFSLLPLQGFVVRAGLFRQMIGIPEFVEPAGSFFRLICGSIDSGFALSLVLDYDIFGAIINQIQRNHPSQAYIGQLFAFLALVIDRIDLRWGGFRPEHGAIWERPLEVIGLYLGSDDPLVLPYVLQALEALMVKWPTDLSRLMEGVADRLTRLTAGAHEIPIVGEQVVCTCLKIWQRIVHVAGFSGSPALGQGPRLVAVLTEQLPRFGALQDLILSLIADLAYYPESGIGAPVYHFLMSQFQFVDFGKKVYLLLVFCNLAVRNPQQVIDAGGLEALLTDALDTVEGCAQSRPIHLAFLKALYQLFAQDNDVVDVIDRGQIVKYLSEIAATEHNELGNVADKLLYHFFTDRPSCTAAGPFADV
jgi:hypothetical protein